MNDDKFDKIVVIRPGEPGYEEAEKDLVNIPGNKPIPLVGFLKMAKNDLKVLKARKRRGETLFDVSLSGVKFPKEDIRPLDDAIADWEAEIEKMEKAIEWTEKKKPGSSKNGNASLIMIEYEKEMGKA